MARSSAQPVSPEFIEGIERRESPRAELVVRVNYQTVDALFSEFARNINEGGLFVETDSPQEVGALVDLEFKLPGRETPLEVMGRVVRTEVTDGDGPAGMGIEFENLDHECRAQINDIVRKLRSTTTS